MRKTAIFFGLVFVFSFLLVASSVNAEHMDEEAFYDMECDTPVGNAYEISVKDGEALFDVTELKFPKNTCVEVVFRNPNNDKHDFTVKYEGERWLHMDANNDPAEDHIGPFGAIQNLTTAEQQGVGIATHYWMTPDEDITLEGFCEVPGHKVAGMLFDVIIGSGTPASSPGFELPLVLFGLISVAYVAKTKRN